MPEYALQEFEHHKAFLVQKSGIGGDEIDLLVKLLLGNVAIIPTQNFTSFLTETKELMQQVDPHDAPFVALALSFRNDGIWTNDKDFQRQSRVPVWRTEQLLMAIGEGRIR